MKAKQLIKELQALVDEHGDRECLFSANNMDDHIEIEDMVRHMSWVMDDDYDPDDDENNYFVLFEKD